MGSGTASEVALALKAGKSVILLSDNELSSQFFKSLDATRIKTVQSAEDAVREIKGKS